MSSRHTIEHPDNGREAGTGVRLRRTYSRTHSRLYGVEQGVVSSRHAIEPRDNGREAGTGMRRSSMFDEGQDTRHNNS